MLKSNISVNYQSKTSLKDQVKNYIMAEIENGKLFPGDKIPTQREISEKFNISNKVAEVALHELELQNIISRRKGKGSFLNDRNIVPLKFFRKTNHVTVFVSSLKNPVFSNFIDIIGRKLLVLRKKMNIAISSDGEAQRHIEMIEKDGTDAIVGIGLPKKVYEYAKNNSIPTIIMAPREIQSHANILIDHEKAGKLAACHLLKCGHRNVVCAGCRIYNDEHDMDSRFKTIADYIRKHGGIVHIIPQKEKFNSNMDYEGVGRTLASKILELSDRPTAIVFFNDIRAISAIKFLQDKKVAIPDEMAVMGFDNIMMGMFTSPSLTSIDLGYERAAETVIQMIAGEIPITQKIVLEPFLIERESTRKMSNKKMHVTQIA